MIYIILLFAIVLAVIGLYILEDDEELAWYHYAGFMLIVTGGSIGGYCLVSIFS